MDETGPDLFFATHLWDGVGDAAEEFVTFWNDQRAAVGLPPDPRPVEEHRWYRQSPQLALVIGLPELAHPKGRLPSYARRIGPIVWAPPATGRLSAQLKERDPSRDLVLVSVSTVGPTDRRTLERIVEAVRSEDVDVLLTIPNDDPPADLPPNVLAGPFLAHGDELFARLTVVVNNAGYGSVTRAACFGLPMLLLPRRGDQFVAARGAAHAGVAISLDAHQTTTPAVREALAALRTEARYRDQARLLAAQAANYHAPSEAAAHIEKLI